MTFPSCSLNWEAVNVFAKLLYLFGLPPSSGSKTKYSSYPVQGTQRDQAMFFFKHSAV